MIEVLEPLGCIAGVRIAVLVSPDGVPVVVRGQRSEEARGEAQAALQGENAESLAALASGWLTALSRAVAPLSWNPPQRVVLRAARGTLVMLHAPGAVLLVVLDRGASPEDLRLPMEGAVARMQRILRAARGAAAVRAEPGPGAALPSAAESKGLTLVPADSSLKQSPREFPG